MSKFIKYFIFVYSTFNLILFISLLSVEQISGLESARWVLWLINICAIVILVLKQSKNSFLGFKTNFYLFVLIIFWLILNALNIGSKISYI